MAKQISEELNDAINELIVEAECVVQANGQRQIDIDSLRNALSRVYTARVGDSLEALGIIARGSKPGPVHGG